SARLGLGASVCTGRVAELRLVPAAGRPGDAPSPGTGSGCERQLGQRPIGAEPGWQLGRGTGLRCSLCLPCTSPRGATRLRTPWIWDSGRKAGE
ncbi:unnamed protein product, partial [Rangifer tarandus platyrhynchus]